MDALRTLIAEKNIKVYSWYYDGITVGEVRTLATSEEEALENLKKMFAVLPGEKKYEEQQRWLKDLERLEKENDPRSLEDREYRRKELAEMGEVPVPETHYLDSCFIGPYTPWEYKLEDFLFITRREYIPLAESDAFRARNKEFIVNEGVGMQIVVFEVKKPQTPRIHSFVESCLNFALDG